MPDIPADYLGKTHAPAPDARVLSLVPSLTELMFDLGLADNLIGRTQFCIHPADEIENVPSVGGTKKIKMDRVRDLAPTHALVNVDENPKEMADELSNMGVDVIVTHPMHPDDNPALYRLIGHAFGAEDKAAAYADVYNDARAAFDDAEAFPPRNASAACKNSSRSTEPLPSASAASKSAASSGSPGRSPTESRSPRMPKIGNNA